MPPPLLPLLPPPLLPLLPPPPRPVRVHTSPSVASASVVRRSIAHNSRWRDLRAEARTRACHPSVCSALPSSPAHSGPGVRGRTCVMRFVDMWAIDCACITCWCITYHLLFGLREQPHQVVRVFLVSCVCVCVCVCLCVCMCVWSTCLNRSVI